MLALAMALLSLFGFNLGPVEASAVTWPSREFTVYMATPEDGGNDANNGLSVNSPVATLGRVHNILWANRPEKDVEVRIGPGVYDQPPVGAWRFYVPGHTVSFMPADYAYGEDETGIESRPVFRNTKCGKNYCPGAWFTMRPPTNADEPLYGGGDSRLRFYYLVVERYSDAGISVLGDSERDVVDTSVKPGLRTKAGKGLNRNLVKGMEFRNIGNKWSGGRFGWGGIVLTHSSSNTILDNRFVDIENRKPHGGYIHGLYITHYSSKNVAKGNRFERISGDPVKVRNYSNLNIVERNLFRRTGVMSYFRAEFCDAKCAREHKMAQQCPSFGNRFGHNRLLGGYTGRKLPTWTSGSGSYPYNPKSLCKVPAQDWRLRAFGNTAR